MRQAEIYFKGEKAGLLTQLDNGYFIYEYNDLWISDDSKPPISLTLPKNKKKAPTSIGAPTLLYQWSGRLDLNQRPPRPERGALPD